METENQVQEPQQPEEPSNPLEGHEADEVEKNAVKRWNARINADKDFFDSSFKRMKENMDFVAGIQWDDQQDVRDSEGRYVINLVLKVVMGLVAQLYAKNPTAEAKMRKRMLYKFWDGSIEMLMEARQAVAMNDMAGFPLNMEAELIMQDFTNGKQMEESVKKVCQTLEHLFQYFMDTAKPDYKEQMKQCIVRVLTCGVAYCIPSFVRDSRKEPSTVEVGHTIIDRVKQAKQIIDAIEDDKIEDTDAKFETLKSLFLSVGHSQQHQADYEVPERIEYDFPPATSIIPDRKIRNLRAFQGARYITHEMLMYLDDVNAFFDLHGEDKIKAGNGVKAYTQDGQPVEMPNLNIADGVANAEKEENNPVVSLRRVFDITTKTDFYLVDGCKKFVRKPMPLEYCISGFWPVLELVFNAIEVDNTCKAKVFPASLVDVLRDAQKEWNRTRDALRAQRNANAPTYLSRKNTLTDDDKEKIRNRQPNEIVEIEGVPPDMPLKDAIVVLQTAQIDSKVYDTGVLEQDIQLGGGAQQADIGPAQPDVTATVGTIAEQSRLQLASSYIDDLDGFLSRVARAVGEMSLQGFSQEVVEEIVGQGAAWPTDEFRKDFINLIDMTIKAASSGRPNQALRINARRELIPLLLQSGANPFAVIEDLAVTMDETIDVQKFFPLPGQALSMAPQPPQQPQAPGKPTGAQQKPPPKGPAPGLQTLPAQRPPAAISYGN